MNEEEWREFFAWINKFGPVELVFEPEHDRFVAGFLITAPFLRGICYQYGLSYRENEGVLFPDEALRRICAAAEKSFPDRKREEIAALVEEMAKELEHRRAVDRMVKSAKNALANRQGGHVFVEPQWPGME